MLVEENRFVTKLIYKTEFSTDTTKEEFSAIFSIFKLVNYVMNNFEYLIQTASIVQITEHTLGYK